MNLEYIDKLIKKQILLFESTESALNKLDKLPIAKSRFGKDIENQVKTPFEYYGDERPYSGTNEYNIARKNPIITKINLKDLIATEGGQEKDKLKDFILNYNKYNEPIVVVKYQNKYYINDGHHRATAAYLLNKKDINAKLIDCDNLTKS